MVENFHIRRASVSDAALLSEISIVTFSDTFKGTCTDDDLESFVQEHFNETQVEKELQDESDFYFIGYLNEIAVGYIRLKQGISDIKFVNDYKAIELKRIYVLKEYLSKKIGAALLDFALNFALQNDFKILWLGVWEHNERAKAFYKKYDFINSGVEHPFPIGSTPQTDVWLYKFLKI